MSSSMHRIIYLISEATPQLYHKKSFSQDEFSKDDRYRDITAIKIYRYNYRDEDNKGKKLKEPRVSEHNSKIRITLSGGSSGYETFDYRFMHSRVQQTSYASLSNSNYTCFSFKEERLKKIF